MLRNANGEAQLTTNRAYETDFYRHPSQTMSYVLPNHTLGDVYGSPTYSSNRDTPVPESEGKAIGTHRKRVPVAVRYGLLLSRNRSLIVK